jgi:hypothetical protein
MYIYRAGDPASAFAIAHYRWELSEASGEVAALPD